MAQETPAGGMGPLEYSIYSGCGTVIFVVFMLGLAVTSCS